MSAADIVRGSDPGTLSARDAAGQNGSLKRVFRPARALLFVAFSDFPNGFASHFPSLPGARPASPCSISSFLETARCAFRERPGATTPMTKSTTQATAPTTTRTTASTCRTYPTSPVVTLAAR